MPSKATHFGISSQPQLCRAGQLTSVYRLSRTYAEHGNSLRYTVSAALMRSRATHFVIPSQPHLCAAGQLTSVYRLSRMPKCRAGQPVIRARQVYVVVHVVLHVVVHVSPYIHNCSKNCCAVNTYIHTCTTNCCAVSIYNYTYTLVLQIVMLLVHTVHTHLYNKRCTLFSNFNTVCACYCTA